MHVVPYRCKTYPIRGFLFFTACDCITHAKSFKTTLLRAFLPLLTILGIQKLYKFHGSRQEANSHAGFLWDVFAMTQVRWQLSVQYFAVNELL